MSLGQIFKAVTNQKPESWKEREATDALIEQLTDRINQLEVELEVERGKCLDDLRLQIWREVLQMTLPEMAAKVKAMEAK